MNEGATEAGVWDLDRRAALQAGVSGLAFAGLASSGLAGTPRPAHGPRTEQSFDGRWRFHRGDVPGAEAPSHDDSAWRMLDLPHDWRIEDLPAVASDDGGATADPSLFAYTTADPLPRSAPRAIGPFDADADTVLDADLKVPPVGSVKIPGGRGQAYTVAGVGWYRKRFKLPPGTVGRRVELRFDGVYQNSDVWLNGVHLGFHPNGYISYAHDITPHLSADDDNVLAVRVDDRGKTSRWYSGSGIYRHCWLTITDRIRIPFSGIWVTTPKATKTESVARVEVTVVSDRERTVQTSVRTTILDMSGKTIAAQIAPPQELNGGSTIVFVHSMTVPRAALWSPDTPDLYRLRCDVLVEGRVVDSHATAFGFRSLAFGAQGMLLNGRPIKVRGANIHHDHGPLGAMSLDRSEERKIQILKASGFNAIRTAHNPASPSLLDACDRLGMLVYTEFSDCWDKPKMAQDYSRFFVDHWQKDLTAFILRDRNHPSIIIWSIGNEIFEDPNNYGPKLAACARALDGTRPISQGGFNVTQKDRDPWAYADIGDYHSVPPSAARAAHPDKAFLQSEDTSPSIYDDWKLANDATNYVGTWVWAGWDYLGESGGGATTVAKDQTAAIQASIGAITGQVGYPWVVSGMGDIDLIGQRKPQNYWRAVVNGLSPLEMMVERPVPSGMRQFNVFYTYYDELESWTWHVPPGQLMKVRIYTQGDSVTLFLNSKPFATKAVAEKDKRVVTFDVPYFPGNIVAIATLNGKELARKTLETVGRPTALRMVSDVRSLTTARDDLAHILVEVVDEEGRLVPDAVTKLTFSIEGAGTIAGVANGNPHNADSFHRPRRWTWHGRALAIVRPDFRSGQLTLTARAEGLRPALHRLLVTEIDMQARRS